MSVVSHSTCLGDELSLPWWEISFSSFVISKCKNLTSIKVKVIKKMYITTLFKTALELGLSLLAVFFRNKINTDLEQRKILYTLKTVNIYYTGSSVWTTTRHLKRYLRHVHTGYSSSILLLRGLSYYKTTWEGEKKKYKAILENFSSLFSSSLSLCLGKWGHTFYTILLTLCSWPSNNPEGSRLFVSRLTAHAVGKSGSCSAVTCIQISSRFPRPSPRESWGPKGPMRLRNAVWCGSRDLASSISQE